MEACSQVLSAASSSSSSILQPLRDHHASTPNVLCALHGRERQLLTVMTLKQDLEDKNAKLSAAQLMPASQAKKVCYEFVPCSVCRPHCAVSWRLKSMPLSLYTTCQHHSYAIACIIY